MMTANSSKMNAEVFLDRDGTINRELGYLSTPEAIELISGAARAIRLINYVGLRVVVVSNQSGAERGYFSLSAVEEANRRLELLLAQEDAYLDDIYCCPHGPEDGCSCRKPEPGLLRRAAEELRIDLPSSYMAGDRAEDIGVIHSVGGKGILVLTGYGGQQQDWPGRRPDFVAGDLLEAAYWIVSQEGTKRREKMAISKELLEILACPKCKADIVLTESGDGLICKACKPYSPNATKLLRVALPFIRPRWLLRCLTLFGIIAIMAKSLQNNH